MLRTCLKLFKPRYSSNKAKIMQLAYLIVIALAINTSICLTTQRIAEMTSQSADQLWCWKCFIGNPKQPRSTFILTQFRQYDHLYQVFMNCDLSQNKQLKEPMSQSNKPIPVLPLTQCLTASFTASVSPQAQNPCQSNVKSEKLECQLVQSQITSDLRGQNQQKKEEHSSIIRTLGDVRKTSERIVDSEQQHIQITKTLSNSERTQQNLQSEDANNRFLEGIMTEIISQTQLKEDQASKVEDSNRFFMSIKSQQSQVAILDQQGERDSSKQEFGLYSEQIKVFPLENKCKSENQGRSSSQESQNTLFKKGEVIIQTCQLNVEKNKSAAQSGLVEKETKQIGAFQPLFIGALTQEFKIEQKTPEKEKNQLQQSIVQSSSVSQKKLNYVSCNINLTIDKQNIVTQKDQSQVSEVQKPAIDQKEKSNEEGPVDIVIPKVQPLDIKTLSVLTLSSPEGIKSIRPPSPKIEGERKIKPWEKLKKLKPTDSAISDPTQQRTFSVITQPTQNRAASTIIQSSQQAQKKQLNSENLANKSHLQSASNPNESPLRQPKNEQKSLGLEKTSQANMQIQQKVFESQVLKTQQTYEQIKKKYSYVSSIVDSKPNVSKSMIEKPGQDRKISNEKNEQVCSKLAAENLVKKVDSLKQPQMKDSLVHEQAKNHPLLRYYPAQFKAISKEEALVEDEPVTPKQLILEQKLVPAEERKQIIQRVEQSIQEEGRLQDSDENKLNQKLSSKKSGSEIINDSSFEAKKSQKSTEIKMRLQQLELQIQRQKKINKQLEVSSSFQRRLLLSLLTGLAAGSISLFLRKDKLGSMLLAVATGVSTYILKK